MSRFRVGVVGLGGLGSAAAWWASRRLGDGVIGFERFELGHRRGASEDHSRIIRLSYHRPDAVRLAQDAYRAWAEVEAAAGIELVVRTGGLDLYPAGATIDAADYLGRHGRLWSRLRDARRRRGAHAGGRCSGSTGTPRSSTRPSRGW